MGRQVGSGCGRPTGQQGISLMLCDPRERAAGRSQKATCSSPLGEAPWSPGGRGSVSYHKAEVDVQVLIQEPGHHLRLNVPHKKTMMLARLKQKARSNRWSRIAATSEVLSSSCWAMSTTCHISPTEEAMKRSSNCSRSWSGMGQGDGTKGGVLTALPRPCAALETRSWGMWVPIGPHP